MYALYTLRTSRASRSPLPLDALFSCRSGRSLFSNRPCWPLGSLYGAVIHPHGMRRVPNIYIVGLRCAHTVYIPLYRGGDSLLKRLQTLIISLYGKAVALGACGAYIALGACWSCRSGRACLPLDALGPGGASRPGYSHRARRSLYTLNAPLALRACRSGRADLALGTCWSFSSLRSGGPCLALWACRPSWTSSPCISHTASLAPRPCRPGGTWHRAVAAFRTSWTYRPGRSGDHAILTLWSRWSCGAWYCAVCPGGALWTSGACRTNAALRACRTGYCACRPLRAGGACCPHRTGRPCRSLDARIAYRPGGTGRPCRAGRPHDLYRLPLRGLRVPKVGHVVCVRAYLVIVPRLTCGVGLFQVLKGGI